MPCWFQNSSSCGRYTRWQKSECVSICGVTWSWWEDLFWWEYMCACVFAAGLLNCLNHFQDEAFDCIDIRAHLLPATAGGQDLYFFYLLNNKNKKKLLILTSHACLHHCVGGCPFTILILACFPAPSTRILASMMQSRVVSKPYLPI